MTERSHATCQHVKYRMTCAQYDELRAEACGRCQICDQKEPYTPARHLYLDHDKALGYWAVRGLLCLSCNHSIDRKVGAIVGPEVDRYRANPWYQRLPYAHLIEPEAPEDGPILDHETALALVVAATAPYVRARDGGRQPERAEASANLRDAVRAAARSGVRQIDLRPPAAYCLASGCTRLFVSGGNSLRSQGARKSAPDRCPNRRGRTVLEHRNPAS